MRFLKYILIVTAIMLPALLLACAAENSYRLPVAHPPLSEMGERRVFCTKCHGYKKEPIDFERYNHNALFTGPHRIVAYQDERVCALCHSQTFCSDCHANHTELKPTIKNPTENYRRVQHRGDFLARHRIEGRMDPTLCFRCHGSPKSSQTCQPCHG